MSVAGGALSVDGPNLLTDFGSGSGRAACAVAIRRIAVPVQADDAVSHRRSRGRPRAGGQGRRVVRQPGARLVGRGQRCARRCRGAGASSWTIRRATRKSARATTTRSRCARCSTCRCRRCRSPSARCCGRRGWPPANCCHRRRCATRGTSGRPRAHRATARSRGACATWCCAVLASRCSSGGRSSVICAPTSCACSAARPSAVPPLLAISVSADADNTHGHSLALLSDMVLQ